jgi:isopentenyl-diphosphate delta-isomerase
VAQRLVAAGVGGLDVSGAGGTSWTRVEQLRAKGAQEQLGSELSGWGIPTAAAVASIADLGVPVVASGGLRTGTDVAKALALGATLGGMALPYLRAQASGGREGVEAAIQVVEASLRATTLLTGSSTIAALRTKPRVLTGTLPSWIAALRGAA